MSTTIPALGNGSVFNRNVPVPSLDADPLTFLQSHTRRGRRVEWRKEKLSSLTGEAGMDYFIPGLHLVSRLPVLLRLGTRKLGTG